MFMCDTGRVGCVCECMTVVHGSTQWFVCVVCMNILHVANDFVKEE